MGGLTEEQLVVENFPLRIESSEPDFDSLLLNGKGKNFIYTQVYHCFTAHPPRAHLLKDETIVGIKEIKELFFSLKTLSLSRFNEFLNLLEEVNSIDKEKVLKDFNKIFKNFHDSKEIFISKEERKVLLKIFREPYNYLEEIEKLYSVILNKNTDVVKNSGVNFEISPITTLYTLKNSKISAKQKIALLYFTNINWYEKKVAPVLFSAISLHLNDISVEILVRNTNRLFWEKIKNHLETFIDFYRRRLLVLSLTTSYSVFETYYLSFLLSLKNTSSDDIANFKKLLHRTKKARNG